MNFHTCILYSLFMINHVFLHQLHTFTMVHGPKMAIMSACGSLRLDSNYWLPSEIQEFCPTELDIVGSFQFNQALCAVNTIIFTRSYWVLLEQCSTPITIPHMSFFPPYFTKAKVMDSAVFTNHNTHRVPHDLAPRAKNNFSIFTIIPITSISHISSSPFTKSSSL